jgi:hypothetical protein
MQYLVDGKPVEGVPTRDVNNLRVAHERPEAEAVLISRDAALQRYKKLLKILYGFLAVIIALAPPGLAAADPHDWVILVPMVAVIWAIFAWFLPFMFRRKVRQFAARMNVTTLPAAPGTAVRVDQTGLTIGGKSWTWPLLSIDSIELTRSSTGGDYPTSYTILQSLGLAAGGERIQLDGNMLSTGSAILDQIYRRLKRAA